MAVGARPFIVGALAIFSALFLHLISAPPPHNKEWNERCSLLPYQHFWLQSNRVITPNGTIPAAVEINEGKIISIVKRGTDEKEIEASIIVDYGNAVIMPGLIDVHVHLNEPGREWEGFETGTRAAAAGGVTTIVDMPLNTAPTTITKEALLLKVNTSIGKLYVDVGFWGGLVPENAFNTTTLTELLDAGVLGLKSFMSPSGINDFPNINAAHMKEGLQILSSYGRPLLVHAEIPQPSLEHRSMTELDSRQRRLYSTYLETRPPSWEVAALQEILPLAKDTAKNGSLHGSHLHIVHLSDADTTLDLIKEAKAMGASISVETCPHYLLFSAEEIEDGDTRFKCAPPIRDAYNKLKLWKALNVGDIDMLSSDHSPSNPELKLLDTGDFLGAWGGISSLQEHSLTKQVTILLLDDFEISKQYLMARNAFQRIEIRKQMISMHRTTSQGIETMSRRRLCLQMNSYHFDGWWGLGLRMNSYHFNGWSPTISISVVAFAMSIYKSLPSQLLQISPTISISVVAFAMSIYKSLPSQLLQICVR